MISSLDSASLNFLNGMNLIQQQSDRAQQELTTGRKINSVSDAPDQIPILAQTHASLDQVQQINSNMTRVKTEVDSGETALSSAVTLVERAQTLATQGQSSFLSADSREQIASELGSVLQQMVAVANTSVEGRYIFSGDQDQTAPYTIDLTQSNPISPYAGSAATRQIQSPDGTLIPVGLTAQAIFDSSNPQNNVFQAINNVRTALLNNDQNAINAALPNLASADTYLNSQLASYGVSQDRVNSAISYGSTLVTQLQTQLSGIQDADMTQAITDLTQAQTQQQAALASRAKLPNSSLFDYLG